MPRYYLIYSIKHLWLKSESPSNVIEIPKHLIYRTMAIDIVDSTVFPFNPKPKRTRTNRPQKRTDKKTCGSWLGFFLHLHFFFCSNGKWLFIGQRFCGFQWSPHRRKSHSRLPVDTKWMKNGHVFSTFFFVNSFLLRCHHKNEPVLYFTMAPMSLNHGPPRIQWMIFRLDFFLV